MNKDNILEVRGLTKHYASVTALDGVDLDVPVGSVFGLLGPNGAGKTTLLRIINNILISDAGTVTVDGHNVGQDTVPLLGYMPEERGLYGKMSVEDQILYFGKLRGGEPRRLREVMDEYMQLFNIEGMRKRKVEELSKGNQQKVQIVATLVHEPRLVILDEPFSGFDPINGILLRQLIDRLSERGTTVMLSSHNMPAVEEMCSEIALINSGRVILSGRIDDIKESNRDGSLFVTTRNPLSENMLADSGLTASITSTQTQGRRKGSAYIIKPVAGASNADLLRAISAQADIVQFDEMLPSLNDLFIRYTLGNNSDK